MRRTDARPVDEAIVDRAAQLAIDAQQPEQCCRLPADGCRVMPEMITRRAIVGFVLASTLGCAPGNEYPTVVRRDSAGIEIVESIDPVWAAGRGWEIDEDPMLDIGALEAAEEYELYRVVGAVRLSDGRIVVVNSGSHELRFYNGDGEFITAVGREGGGPGEFLGMDRVRRIRNDSLAVGDYRMGRVSIFDAHGAYGRSMPTEEATRRYFIIGAFEDGEILLAGGLGLAGWTDGERGTGVVLDSLLYVTARGSQIAGDTVGTFPAAGRYVTTDGYVWSVTQIPFGEAAVAAVGRSQWYFSDGRSFWYGQYTRSGELERIVRFARPNRLVTQSDIDRYIQHLIANVSAERQRYWRNRMRTTPFPEEMTAFESFAVDAAENLWVEEFRPDWDSIPHHWVFDSSGVLLGSIALPPRLRAFDIGNDYVLGRWTDSLGIEHVRMHRLSKP